MDTSVQAVSAQDQEAIEWQARVDLAAAHRIAVMHDLAEGIMNHFTLVVPGKPDRYLHMPFGLHWAEVTASCFMEVSLEDGRILKGDGRIQRSAYCIHAPIHRLAPHAKCVLHTHMPYASALTRLKDPRIKLIGQTEIGVARDAVYDMHFDGPVRDVEEGERLARVLGDKNILFMANHGVLVTGRTVAEAYDRLYYLERAAQVQMYAMWTNQELLDCTEEAVTRTARIYSENVITGSKSTWDLHFEALKRIIDRNGSDYRN
ncbi:aldolase [Pigmentiphaga soli]|uniref:Aldolase n=1 Tax=Pigmentiphaga soli TaxID=1007095 RepID=A0ABP8H038_9BURK